MTNWDKIAADWEVFKGNARHEWSKLSEDDLNFIAGRRDRLVQKIQEIYLVTKEEAERQADKWESDMVLAGSN